MTPLEVLRFAAVGLLAGFALIVFWKLFTGSINMSGVLSVKGGAHAGDISVARLQLLVTTVAFVGHYIDGVVTTGALPDIPMKWLAVFGASHIAYAGSKAWSVFRASHQQEG